MAAGSTPSAGPGAGCGEGGKRPKGLALVSSALPYPPRRSRKDLRLRYWARKGGWGGALERSAVLESFFPAPQSITARGPLDVRRQRALLGVAAPSPSQQSAWLCGKAGSSPARPHKGAAPPQPAAGPQR